MGERNDGGQAFPSHPALYSSADQAEAQGMSIRDWFAGQALIAISGQLADFLTAPDIPEIDVPKFLADRSYDVADAMLAAREKGGTP